MREDLRNYTIATIQGFFANEIENFIEKSDKNPDALVNLVMTLKYWANPLGAYPSNLFTPEELDEDFPKIQKVIRNPARILSNQTFTDNDKEEIRNNKQEIRNLIKARLNMISNELIQKYKLGEKIDKKIKLPTPTEWWGSLSVDTQKQIQQQYNSLDPKQKEIIKKKTSPDTFSVEKDYDTNVGSSPYCHVYYIPDYYYMCNHQAYLDYFLIDALFRASVATVRAGFKVGSNLPNCANCGNCDCSGDCKGLIIAMAIISSIAIISSGIVGGVYALSKAANSLYNLLQGKKILRSLARLTSIGIGGYSGAMLGGIIGGILGSVIPGVGTAIGALVGTIFCSLLVAGLGALAAKQSARYISSKLHADENVPTNPEKYQLTPNENKLVTQKNLDVATINKMLVALRTHKKKIDNFFGSIPGTKENIEKNNLNNLIKQIKKGEIADIYFDKKNYFDATKEGTQKDYYAYCRAKYGNNSSGGVGFFPAASAPPGDPIPSAPPEWMVNYSC